MEEQTLEVVNEVPLKRWKLQTAICGVYQEYYEKVGSPFSFDPQHFCIITYNYDFQMRCYSDDEINVNFMDDSCEAIFSSTRELDISGLEIFPNPTSSMFNITWENQEKYKIELINIQGRVLRSMNDVGSGATLELGQLSPGFYFLKISDKHEFFSQRKIVKL